MQLPNRLDEPDAPNTLGGVFSVFIRCPGPWIMFIPAMIALIVRSTLGPFTWWDLGLAALIVGLWPLNEWVIHYWFLHAKPLKIFGFKFDANASRRHRGHHAKPWLLEWILMDPYELVPTVAAVFAFFWLVTPTIEFWLVGAATYTLMGVHYEWTHLLTHSQYKPKFWLWRNLRSHHLLHHFKNDHYWFGVSSHKSDDVMGTNPNPTDVPKDTEMRIQKEHR